MLLVQRWFSERPYAGFHSRVENSICRYLVKSLKGRLIFEIIEKEQEKIRAEMNSPSIILLVLFSRFLAKLEIDNLGKREGILKIANDRLSKLGKELVERNPGSFRQAFISIILDQSQTITEYAEKIIAALAMNNETINWQ
jgi:hypothetical protein